MNLIKDDIKKLFYKFLITAISSSLAIAIYSLVDTIAIGHGAGQDGTAACAIVLPIFSIALFIALLCGIGGSVLMAHASGEGNKEKGDAYFTASIVLVTIITLIVWIPGMMYQDEFYRLCGADDVIMPFARDYGEWIFVFLMNMGMRGAALAVYGVLGTVSSLFTSIFFWNWAGNSANCI